jgi:hypothetical protein
MDGVAIVPVCSHFFRGTRFPVQPDLQGAASHVLQSAPAGAELARGDVTVPVGVERGQKLDVGPGEGQHGCDLPVVDPDIGGAQPGIVCPSPANYAKHPNQKMHHGANFHAGTRFLRGFAS